MATIILSSILAPYAKQKTKFEIQGKSLFGLLINLIQVYPDLREYLFDVQGDLTRNMNFYLNEKCFPKLGWQNIPIKSTDVVSILLSGRQKSRILSAMKTVPTHSLRLIVSNPIKLAAFEA